MAAPRRDVSSDLVQRQSLPTHASYHTPILGRL